jgi:uncharacterized membrane protein YbjE (DUF340 family)
MKGSIIIVLFFVCGLLLAFCGVLPNWISQNDYSMYVLYLLMFLVGFSVTSDSDTNKVFKQINLRIFIVPLVVIIGSLFGGYIASFLLKSINTTDSMAVSAGFGYYSLSSVFITEVRGESLGVIALVANIIREIVTLLLTPLIVKYFGKLAPIASGGATSMDTTLPIIVQYSGKEYAIVSIFSGVILTILVPIILGFIL